MRGSMKNVAMAAGAGSMVLVASLALSPLAAHAATVASTKTAVKGTATKVAALEPVTFVAQVTPSREGKAAVKATGTVAFSITAGSDTATCTGGNTQKLKASGAATCAVAQGVLDYSATPYSVTATYSGDTNFPGSSGTTSLTVTQITTALALKASPKPTSGAATTFTATLSGAKGISKATGFVTFVLAPTSGTKGLNKCGRTGKPEALVADVATCNAKAGWFTVPAATKTNPHPVASWTVVADYSGGTDSNFAPSSAQLSGSVTS